MGSFKYKPSRMLILFTAMAVLLPVLAALQYFWLGQVSEGASERLASTLRANATGFRHDFNREFIRAYLNFQMDSFSSAADNERYHLDRLARWNQTAPYPRLISEVFVVDYDEHDRPRLSRLNSEAKRIESLDWSGELAKLRDRFEQRSDSSPASTQDSLEYFAEDIPALIIPFPFAPDQKRQSQGLELPPGFTIVKLDLDYMTREFIPTLVRRHFFDASQTDYNLAIVSLNHPEKVIYSSQYPMVDFASSDVSTRVFGLEPDELKAFLDSEAAPARSGQASTRVLRLINLKPVKHSNASPAEMPTSEEDGRWLLQIKHQAGSLAAAVSSARRRNLALSFGILLLLGVGIVMTAISTRRAERLARQQIDFVAGVTHELRTPLAVICSAGENLADGIIKDSEKVAQYGTVVYQEGRRLADMVEQVLEFAGAQSGRQRYEFRPIEVADLIDSAVTACESQAQERNFKIETAIEPHLPAVHGDNRALRRALQNLISNAIKYDAENRWARVSAHKSNGKDGSEVRITVEDRGLGIDSADIPRIFEPFYRGRQAVASQIPGSGVGLSLVKQIVEAHSGRLTVTSTPGTGSAFTFHLPIAS